MLWRTAFGHPDKAGLAVTGPHMQEYPGQLLCNYHDVFVVYRGAEVPARGVTPANPGTVDVADNWDMALGTPTKFIVQRSAGALKEDTTKLELPVNLALAKCYNDGTQDVPCGDGKYLVKSVTAHSWTVAGSQGVGAMTEFFFVGERGNGWRLEWECSEQAAAGCEWLLSGRSESQHGCGQEVDGSMHTPPWPVGAFT